MGLNVIAYPPQTDYSYLADSMSEISLNILVNSIAASSTLNAWDYMFVDIFTDANGADNTIDTGNTTAIFSTDKYVNYVAAGTEAHGIGFTSQTSAQTGKYGFKIVTNHACTLTSITKDSSELSTKAYLLNSAKSVLATADFVGDVATFSVPQELSSATIYYFAVDQDGNSIVHERYYEATFPYNKINFNFTGCLNNGNDASTEMLSIESVQIEAVPSDLLIQTNAITITTGPTSHQVYTHDTLAGTGSITYDISFDNGSTWITDQALGTTNTGSHAGTQMILKLNLNGTGAGNTSKADDYSILLAY